MQSKLLVALFAALALTACQKAEEAAAPPWKNPGKPPGAAADSAADCRRLSRCYAAGAAAERGR